MSRAAPGARATASNPAARPGATSTEAWRQLEALVDAALDLPPADREPFVRARCGDDAALREAALAWLRGCGADDRLLDVEGGAAAVALAPESTPAGACVGPWRLLAELGRGGMGTVHLAERVDAELPMRAALKRLHGASALDPHGARRFREERRILAALAHPNIARLLDGGVDDAGLPWFAMEHVAGAPIDAWCDARALDVDGRLRLFAQVCDAVAHAHRALVVHRDLKPANVLVDADGRVKLLDFGIARLLDRPDDAALTRTGVQPMTPAYASPEQVRGEAPTTATDVHALGVLLYVLLTGRLPYGAGGLGLADRILAGRCPRPSQAVLALGDAAATTGEGAAASIDPGALAAARATTPVRLARRLRGDLDVIVARAMHPEPARRYATVDALADDVRRHLEGATVRARPDTAAYRLRKLVARHPLGTAASAAGLAALVGFAVVTARQAEALRVESVRAAAARDEAEEVTHFLSRTFARTDVHASGGAVPTLREVLDRGAAEADTALRDRPAVRARLLAAIAPAYRALGEWSRERDLLRAAVDAERARVPIDTLRLATRLQQLATAETFLGRPSAALPVARELLQLARALPAAAARPANVDTASVRTLLAGVLRQLGRTAEADAFDAGDPWLTTRR